MLKGFTFILNILICFSLFGQGLSFQLLEDHEDHFKKFSEFNVTHHDNIDDDVEHTHSHKHSDDGEEHDHNHHHTNSVQTDINGIIEEFNIETQSFYITSRNGFYEKFFISSPMPLDIFRPPIA